MRSEWFDPVPQGLSIKTPRAGQLGLFPELFAAAATIGSSYLQYRAAREMSKSAVEAATRAQEYQAQQTEASQVAASANGGIPTWVWITGVGGVAFLVILMMARR